MKIGIFIGRLNPPHFGHIRIIEEALGANDALLLLLGTPHKLDDKNPLTFMQRKDLIQEIIPDEENLTIKKLLDNPSDRLWVESILEKIQTTYPNAKSITFYGGDFENDSAYRVFRQYIEVFSDYSVDFVMIDRSKSHVTHDGSKEHISATNLRQAFKSMDNSMMKKLTPEVVIKSMHKNMPSSE